MQRLSRCPSQRIAHSGRSHRAYKPLRLSTSVIPPRIGVKTAFPGWYRLECVRRAKRGITASRDDITPPTPRLEATHSSTAPDALEVEDFVASQSQRRAFSRRYDASEVRQGLTDAPEASTSGRSDDTHQPSTSTLASSLSYSSTTTTTTPRAAPYGRLASVAHSLPASPAPRRSAPSIAPDLRMFLLGVAAAVAINYLLTFAGTLPVVRRLIRKFIWRADPSSPSLEMDAPENVDVAAAALEAEVEGMDGEDVEWVNLCWRKAWRVYQRGLEQWLAGLLQPLFDGLVAEGMVPRFVQRIRIAEFTFDHEAPYFSNMRRRNSRKDSDLNGVVDVRYTGGARMLLLIECGTGRWRIKVPVLVSDLDLECKMWIKVRLAPMCPWIGTLSLAFVGPPTIKAQLSPYSRVRLMRIPILQPFLTKLLTVDLPGLMTLPQRLEINVPPAVTAVAEAAVGRDAVMRAVASAVLQADALEHALLSALPLGPQGAAGGISLPDLFQGELQVTLREARDLPVWGFPWQSNPYCRLGLGSQAVRSRRDSETSQPSRHRAPVWNQEFQFLVEDVSVQQLEIIVKDSPITGRTEIGIARLPLSSLPLDGMKDVWLPVESSMPGERRQKGAVRVSVSYKPFTDDDSDSGFREAAAYAQTIGEELAGEQSSITDVKSAADASSRANVAASAAAAAIAVTKAAAARAAARLARGPGRVLPSADASLEEGAGSTATAASVSGGEEEQQQQQRRPGKPSSLRKRMGDSSDEDESGGGGDYDGSGNGGSAGMPFAERASITSRVVKGADHVDVAESAVSSSPSSENGNGRAVVVTPPPSLSPSANAERPSLNAAQSPGQPHQATGTTSKTPLPSSTSISSDLVLSSLKTAVDPLQREAAVQELEVMAATMQRLTTEVQALNEAKASDADNAAAAEAAAKTVAAAEALAVAAVLAGDVASANRALQEAAAALELTVTRVAGSLPYTPAAAGGVPAVEHDAVSVKKKEDEQEGRARINGASTDDSSHLVETGSDAGSDGDGSDGDEIDDAKTMGDVLEGAQGISADGELSGKLTNAHQESLTPEQRAAQALTAAQAAAAAAAAAVEALEPHPSQSSSFTASSTPSSTSSLSGSESSTTSSTSTIGPRSLSALRLLDCSGDGGVLSSFLSDEDALLAADAIPSAGVPSQTRQRDVADVGARFYGQEEEDSAEYVTEGAPWWNQAIQIMPGVPPAHNIAADAAADADGSAAVVLQRLQDSQDGDDVDFDDRRPDMLSPTSLKTKKRRRRRGNEDRRHEDVASGEDSTRASRSSQGQEERTNSDQNEPWWGGVVRWFRGGNEDDIIDAAAASPPSASTKKGRRRSGDRMQLEGTDHTDNEGAGAEDGMSTRKKKQKQQEKSKTPEPLGDIIMAPDVPIEEIAAEVRKSWKLRDRHVETLVTKAMESRQRESERPWLVLTSIMATSSAVLLAVVLYRITHGQ